MSEQQPKPSPDGFSQSLPGLLLDLLWSLLRLLLPILLLAILPPLLGLALIAMLAFALIVPQGVAGSAAWLLLAALATGAAIVGRMLFYALVIPTTMPGAFFWRNRGFEEHARQTGLAAMPQVGVVKP